MTKVGSPGKTFASSNFGVTRTRHLPAWKVWKTYEATVFRHWTSGVMQSNPLERGNKCEEPSDGPWVLPGEFPGCSWGRGSPGGPVVPMNWKDRADPGWAQWLEFPEQSTGEERAIQRVLKTCRFFSRELILRLWGKNIHITETDQLQIREFPPRELAVKHLLAHRRRLPCPVPLCLSLCWVGLNWINVNEILREHSDDVWQKKRQVKGKVRSIHI